MIDSVQDAWRLIDEHVATADPTAVQLAQADGLVTAEPIHATGDSPPFDKALMDGYAIRASDYLNGIREFRVVGEVTAGQTIDLTPEAETAIRIMTGAQLPRAADCVIPIEHTQPAAGGRIVVDSPRVQSEWNLARRGQAIRAGDLIIPARTSLGPAQLGALAEMGVSSVQVFPRTTVAIVATGDELVGYDETPGPGQIRNSNELMLVSQVRRAGGTVAFSTIARDERAGLTAAIRRGLESDILVLSGGVSAGVLDLVPSVLAECGCEEVFHGCNIKPGKPIWFGELPADRSPDGRPRWIFGLPGNPVSSMVCFELFVRMGIQKRRGITPPEPQLLPARLATRHVSKDSRPTYFPAVFSRAEEGLMARPLNWQGSFDLQTIALANGFVLLETACERAAGQEVQVLALDR